METKRNWDKVYSENGPRLLAIVRRYVGNSEIAEDILHDAFIKAIEKEHTFSGQGSFEGWLHRVVVNESLQYIRNGKKVVFNSLDTSELILPKVSSEQSRFSTRPLSELLGMNEMMEAIDTLPEHHKAVFNLYVIDHYKHQQIGELLGISEGTSKSHLARGRKKIQLALIEKAKTKEKEEHEYLMWLFFSPNGDAALDTVFESVFSTSTIPVSKVLQQPNESQSALANSTKNLLSKSVLFKTALVIAFSSIVVFIFVLPNNEKPVPEVESEIEKMETSIKPKKDSVAIEETQEQVPVPKEKSKNDKVKTVVKKTVIVKKQIIVVDTVYEQHP